MSAQSLLDGAVPQEEIRAKVGEVLARPEFAQSESAIARALGKLVERIIESISDFLGIGLDSAGTVLLWFVYTILAVAVVFVAWRIGRSMMQRNAPATPEAADADPMTVRRARVAELRERAGAAQAAGDHLLALRLWFTALVVGLGEVGDLEYRDAWTNRELLERGRPRPAVEAALAPLVGDLDKRSFGGVPATEADATAMARLVDKLLSTERPAGERGRGTSLGPPRIVSRASRSRVDRSER